MLILWSMTVSLWRRRRRWRRLGRLQLVIAVLHLVEEVEGSVALRLLTVVEKILFIFFIRIEFFHFRFFFLIIRFQVNLINAKSSCVSHGCHVLSKNMFRKARVSAVDVGDNGRIILAIWPRQRIGYHITFSFKISDVSGIFTDFR